MKFAERRAERRPDRSVRKVGQRVGDGLDRGAAQEVRKTDRQRHPPLASPQRHRDVLARRLRRSDAVGQRRAKDLVQHRRIAGHQVGEEGGDRSDRSERL